jgi:nitrate/TMAO reductase-like tetraheme cytochrome c subunit
MKNLAFKILFYSLRIIYSLPVRLVIIVVLAGGIVIAPLFLLALTDYTRTSATFCESCHQYQQDVDVLSDSIAHPADIGCAECHAENTPSLISDRHYKNDEHLDLRCLGCHAPVLEGNVSDIKVELRKKDLTTGEILNDNIAKYNLKELHEWHFNEKNQCVDCHRNIQHDRFDKKSNLPRIEFCVECHPQDDFAKARPLPEMVYVKE